MAALILTRFLATLCFMELWRRVYFTFTRGHVTCFFGVAAARDGLSRLEEGGTNRPGEVLYARSRAGQLTWVSSGRRAYLLLDGREPDIVRRGASASHGAFEFLGAQIQRQGAAIWRTYSADFLRAASSRPAPASSTSAIRSFSN